MLNIIFVIHFREFLEDDELVDRRMDLLASLGLKFGEGELVLFQVLHHVG